MVGCREPDSIRQMWELRTHIDWLSVKGHPGHMYLCGASIDLDWLATHFDAVVGTELIPAAVERFFVSGGTSGGNTRGPSTIFCR